MQGANWKLSRNTGMVRGKDQTVVSGTKRIKRTQLPHKSRN